MTEQPILVLGATGKTGRRVADRLRADGQRVRAASRSGETRFDWTEPSTWDSALSGVRAAFLVAPEDEPGVPPEFVRRAAEHGVPRLVLLSARGVEELGDDALLAAEHAVRGSGAEWTILRPSWFDQNFDEGMFRPALLAGELVLPVGDGLEPFIDAGDIADVAVAALTGDGHAGRTYELTGPRALSFAEAVGLIASASGRPIRFTDLPAEQFAAAQLADGVPKEAVDLLTELFETIRLSRNAAVTDDVRHVLGRPPRDFTTYATTWR
ncbi:NAD(P)H-binding protein [Amycolatopsis nigrescens]|uniref:NAD(P)H-binding protein n=1 Tax=Amycolatopsis nigrescens TaxID=381445 RepID=UPI00037766F5|nr:NAD(P)H-binding protein [Amycolatopsis nigrescens]